MLTARDYQNNEFPLLATKVHTSELNGQDDLELRIPQQKNNNLDLLSIDKLWELDYNNITYKIVYVKQQTRGNGFYLNVRATPLFYWDFDKSIIHANHDGSHTANEAFRRVFEGSGYNYVLVDFSPSLEWEGFGKGATRLEMFKRLIDRYGYEFTINGSTVTMRHLVGNDTNFMYKYKLNASNVSKSTDASAMFTHIKGFGNFDEGEEDYFNKAKLKREFTSPLASILGKWEGKPVVDGRIKQSSTLDEAMQKAVEDSLEISVEGTLHDVRQMGYDVAVPTKGDRVWLHDEHINLEQEIRVYSVKTTYDERDNIIDCEVTFGSQSIRERHKASINSLSKNFADLLTGQLKLPTISLEKIGRDMINAIHAASSEIVFGDFGMQAISKTNPDKYTEISPAGAHFRNGHVRISTSSGRDVINNGFILRNPAVSWTYPHSFGPDVRQGDGEFSKNYILTSSDQYQTGGFFSFSHEARYLRVYVTLNTLSSSPAARARLRMTNQYSNEHRTTLNDDLEYGSRLLMDIGEPLDYGVRRYAYVEFRKEGTGDTVAGMRINTREQTDFP